jgi:hypothetical protein
LGHKGGVLALAMHDNDTLLSTGEDNVSSTNQPAPSPPPPPPYPPPRRRLRSSILCCAVFSSL